MLDMSHWDLWAKSCLWTMSFWLFFRRGNNVMFALCGRLTSPPPFKREVIVIYNFNWLLIKRNILEWHCMWKVPKWNNFTTSINCLHKMSRRVHVKSKPWFLPPMFTWYFILLSLFSFLTSLLLVISRHLYFCLCSYC